MFQPIQVRYSNSPLYRQHQTPCLTLTLILTPSLTLSLTLTKPIPNHNPIPNATFGIAVDEGNSVDVIYLDFAKAFDKVPHQRLLLKLRAHGIGGNILRWIQNWLSNRKQRVCVGGVESSWQSVLSGVPQGSVMGPVLFLIFINDLDTGIYNHILKFADNTKVFGSINNTDDSSKLQDDLNKLVNWSQDWQMKFNVDKCKVMHLGRKNLHSTYSMNGSVFDSIKEEKDLGIHVSEDLKWSTQCQHAYTKANRVLGMIHRTIISRDMRILLSLYKTLVRPHLEYSSPAWSLVTILQKGQATVRKSSASLHKNVTWPKVS